ncbi:MAG: Putative glycosyltransferase [uncultured Chloroflexi bacterium]|uniref:Glycosyltransferase n=1 Tax=uncultured Chloroflexota bacterium TaxID=166587 RepID=A0A6J4JMX7_9CHLR|nr:MAG: Putative glycosyltransferase [uncultured Chloroflexota bacterium]
MRILFATIAADGHVNPLTGLAMHLKAAGHDVRWYTGRSYATRLERLGIPHVPYQRATEVNSENIAELFPERARLRGPALIRFDAEHIFIGNVEQHFEDVRDVDATWPFDALVCDAAFYAARLIKEKLGKRVCSIGVAPSLEIDKDVPPAFSGLRPAGTGVGRLLHRCMGAAMDWLVMGPSKASYNRILVAHGLAPIEWSLFDEPYRSPDVVFQSGVPSLDYPRKAANPKVRFVGALLPYRAQAPAAFPYADRLGEAQRVILISQGTVDNRDPKKLIVPALDALVDSGALLVVGTGHANTEQLRRAYPQANVVVEDYVDFAAVLDRADLFICNGGYGSVLLSLSKGVPEYVGVGINLRSENPSPERIRRAADRVLSEPSWKARAMQLREELSRYRPYELIDAYLATTVAPSAGAQQHTGGMLEPRAAATREPAAPIRQSG